MTVVISGTNREDSNTIRVAGLYHEMLTARGQPSTLVSLVGLDVLTRNDTIRRLETECLVRAGKFVFVCPEYNGSFPGVVKCLIDNSDISKVWWGKKALLTGVSTGRAGNLRGMDHLTGILHYLKVVVHPNKLPISVVDTLFGTDRRMSHSGTLAAIEQQLDEFISF